LTKDPNASKIIYINSNATSGMNGEEMTFKNKTDLENFAISSFALNYILIYYNKRVFNLFFFI
jgi:hypothetical protein